MTKSKSADAATLRETDTLYKVNERVEKNDARELVLLQNGLQLNPLEMLQTRLETAIEILLGPGRYIRYVKAFQGKREEVLDQAEGVLARQKLQLPDPSTSTLLVPGK